MVHCACELYGRTPVDHLTFGEFCILVTGLRRHYARKFVSLSFFFLWHLNCFPGIFMLSPPVLWATEGIILFTCLSVCMCFGRCVLWLVCHRLLVCAYFISLLLLFFAFSALPSVLWRCWLGGRKGIRPVKNWAVGCWRGYLSGVRCRLAYVPADATATHCLLLQ